MILLIVGVRPQKLPPAKRQLIDDPFKGLVDIEDRLHVIALY